MLFYFFLLQLLKSLFGLKMFPFSIPPYYGFQLVQGNHQQQQQPQQPMFVQGYQPQQQQQRQQIPQQIHLGNYPVMVCEFKQLMCFQFVSALPFIPQAGGFGVANAVLPTHPTVYGGITNTQTPQQPSMVGIQVY